MIVRVRYLAQVRHAAGRSAEEVEVEDGCTVAALAARLAEARHTLRGVLASPTLLTFVGDEQARAGQVLGEGDEIIFTTPISGG